MKKWNVVEAFAHLGAVTNNRYAWSAQSPDGSITVVTLWTDEVEDDGARVTVDFFNHPKLAVWSTQRGHGGQQRHLQHVWDTDRVFRVVMVKAKDAAASPRTAIERWPEDSLTMHLTAFDPITGAFRAEGTRTATKGTNWTDGELEACVKAYRRLWLAQQAGEQINKSNLRRTVVANDLRSRSEGAYERRMQNISAVIKELGLDFVSGYVPLDNIGRAKGRIISLINNHWARAEIPEASTADPEHLATRVESAARKLKIGHCPPPEGSQTVERVTSSAQQFVRDPNVIAWILHAAQGVCEACGEAAPFSRDDGSPFLEVHHLRRLADGGPDTVDNAIAGCPNCHRRLHHANDRDTYRRQIIKCIDRLVDHPKRKLA